MPKTLHVALVLSCFWMFASTLSVQALDDGSGAFVNPFTQGEDQQGGSRGSYSTRISDEPEPGFRLPGLSFLPKPSFPKIQLVPNWSRRTSTPTNQPSAWDKVSGGAKNLFTSTKRTLMPWTKDSSSTSRQDRSRSSARTSHRSRSNPRPKPRGKTIFSSWFSPKEEEKEIRSVNDFLSLPPVPYE